jgi:glucose-6-phosphate isomerase
MNDLSQLKPWQALLKHQQMLALTSIRDLFVYDTQRFEQFSLEAADIFLDYSKNWITSETLQLLIQLAEARQLRENITQLFSDYPLNNTENCAALHTALREPQPRTEVSITLKTMQNWATKIREGKWRGFTQKPITDIVHIGIGGSDIGPRMAIEALSPYVTESLQFHFISNIDSNQTFEALKCLKPENTLFIIASKSFNSPETLLNGQSAKKWLCSALGDEAIASHFVGITANPGKAIEFGIPSENILPMWDWVGGRYSIWSAIGFPLMIAIGANLFQEFLSGAHAMDEHFRHADFTKNMPVILGLLDIWYINFFNTHSLAIIPYDYYLRLLPTYLQQLMMESNGKSIQRNGARVNYATGSIVWGGVGVDGQHTFHQLLFQGTQLVPVDFIIPVNSHHAIEQHHQILFANLLAQSQALMQGKPDELAPHKSVNGNQPSNTILMPKLTPKTLGALLALYEHRTFVQGVIWNINSFDQWGVELGKKMAKNLITQLEKPGTSLSPEEGSTQGLIDYFHKNRQ